MAEYDIDSMHAEDLVIRYFNAVVRVYPGPLSLDRHVIQIFDNYDNLRIRAEDVGGDYMAIIPELINVAMNTHLEADEFTYATLMVPHSRFLAVQIIVKPSQPLPFYSAPGSEDDLEIDLFMEARSEILRQLGVDPDDPEIRLEQGLFKLELPDQETIEDESDDFEIDDFANDGQGAIGQGIFDQEVFDQETFDQETFDGSDEEDALEDDIEGDVRSNAEQFYIRIMSIYQRMMVYDQIERAEMLLFQFLQNDRQREIIRQNHDRQESAFNDVADLIEEWIDICAVE